ncbi:MAG: hypothetical protein M1820_001274 [Bogoriella megaspora]|nr:MAG: hypothetical protein M1820_001274 [Bogoriella megaspora]
MERFNPLHITRAATALSRVPRGPLRSQYLHHRPRIQHTQFHRSFHISVSRFLQPRPAENNRESGSFSSYAQPASELNHDIGKEEMERYDREVSENKEKQIRTPWHRDGSDLPPVTRQRSAGAMTKGKLLTTPSRMLKLILPLTTSDRNSDRKSVEPLALLVHPQQPLSYLERLIQSELPAIKSTDRSGNPIEKIPNVFFRAEDSTQDSLEPKKLSNIEKEREQQRDTKEATSTEPPNKAKHEDEDNLENPDETHIDGTVAKTGKLNSKSPSKAQELRGGPGEGGVETYSGLGHTASSQPPSSPNKEIPHSHRHFVRWSSSTEVGDFIRDAARGKEFAVEIENAPREIFVGVPSFLDRTYYLRTRLRKKSREIASLAGIKRECDEVAHQGAQRMAIGGLGILCVWWGVVYLLTFQTSLGWDVMEPVTYLVSLSTIMGGYVWFLYHNREVSYRSAMNFTISRRQQKLYESKGFDLATYTHVVEEGNALRKEIKQVAGEYDVEWDESMDEDVGMGGSDGKEGKGRVVKEALKEGRKNEKKEKGKKEDEDED